MANMGNDSEMKSLFVEGFGGCCTSDPITVFQASMFSNLSFSVGGATGKEFANTMRKLLDILAILHGSTCGRSLPLSRTNVTVSKAFTFSLFKRLGFNENPLSFVAFPGSTPFQHHR